MAFLSTAASLLGKIANIGLTSAGIYSIFKGGSSSMPVPYGGSVAMPGGASSMGSYGLPLLGGAALGAGLAGLSPFTPGSPYGGIGEPGGLFGGGSQIAPVPVRGGYRMPHQVMVPHPTDPSRVVTYVKAPPVRYRVSIRPYKRRCAGGR